MNTNNSHRAEINVEGMAKSLSHYCDAVLAGEFLFISGMVALDENNKVVGEGDVVAQADAVHANIAKVLNHVGASFADIVKVTVLLTDVEDRTKINPVRMKYFGKSKPASTLFEVSKLALPELLIEIEAVVRVSRA